MLAFACAFTMFAGAAFTDEADIQAKDAVNMLTSLGVIEGLPDGSFNPDRVVTRAEMAKMIFVVRNNTIDDEAYQNIDTDLVDINNHWAKGYIKFCESQNIIAGKGKGIFDPDAPVTGVEAAKMLLVLAGYTPDKAGLTGSAWQTNTLRYAGAAGILDSVSSSLSAGLPRQWAAQMIANTLDADRVLWSNDSETFDQMLNGGKKETVGQAYMDLCYDYGTLTVVDTDTLTVVINNAYSAENYHDGWTTVQFTKVGADYSDLLGQTVKVMFKDGKTNDVIGVYAISDNTVYNTLMNGVELDGNKIKFGGSSYAVDSTRAINLTYVDAEDGASTDTVNISYFDSTAKNNAGKTSLDEVTFVDSDGNNKIDTAIVFNKVAGEVTYVGSDRITMQGQTYKFADVDVDDEIAADDYAVMSYDLYADCSVITKADVVSGEFSGTKDKDDYKQYEIDGNWYNISTSADVVPATGHDDVTVGDTVLAYVCNGVIINVTTDDGTGAIPSNIAVVVGAGNNSLNGDQVKLRFFDGTLKTVTLDKVAKADGSATTAVKGRAYKVSGSDSSTRLDELKDQKYNGYAFETDSYAECVTIAEGKTTLHGDAIGATNGKLSSIDGINVNDNATIILWDGNTDNGQSKVITGKQFKAIADDDTDLFIDAGNPANAGTAYFTKSINGVDRVMLAAVAVKDVNVSGASYDNYGYVVADGTERTNGDVSIKIWDGSEYHDVLVESADSADYAKGTLVAYASIDADGYLVDSYRFGTMEDIKKAGTTGVNDAFAGANLADSASVITIEKSTMNVTADTHVILVDSDLEGEDVGQPYTYGTTKLAKATKVAEGDIRINTVYSVDGDGVVSGANKDGEDLELVVIDITGAFDFNRPDSKPVEDDDDDTTTSGNVTISGLEGVKINTSRIGEGVAQVVLDVTDKEVDGITGDASVKVDGVNASTVTTKFVNGQIQIDVTDKFVTKDSQIVVDLSGVELVTLYTVTEEVTDEFESEITYKVVNDDNNVTVTATHPSGSWSGTEYTLTINGTKTVEGTVDEATVTFTFTAEENVTSLAMARVDG